MFCSCGRRRVAPRGVEAPQAPAGAAKSPPQPFVAKIQGFTPESIGKMPRTTAFATLTPEPLMLTIRIPKRTRWAAHDEPHQSLFKQKARDSLKHLERLPEGERRFRAAIIFFNDIIAQPVFLASHSTFRNVAVKKFEEIEAWFKANPRTRFEDEFLETNYQWHELMTELHDHPLYKED